MMASSPRVVYACFFFYILLLSSTEGKDEAGEARHFHTVQVASLFPSDSCEATPTEFKEDSVLKVVHRHGPCSGNSKEVVATPEELLLEDEARVTRMQKQLDRSKMASDSTSAGGLETSAAVIPANYGLSLGTGNYVVQVGLGTPVRRLSLVFDTGSGLTWTQCQPCSRQCYVQKDPIFSPAQSASYANVSCTSPACSSLKAETGLGPSCSVTGKACVYGIAYGDNSFSVGYLASDKLTVSQSDVFGNYYFGCGQNNHGLYGQVAGLLGLATGPLSFISQTASKYNKLFAYCIPSSSSTTGYLAFGSPGFASTPVVYTPISASSPSSLYGIDIFSIAVGGETLPIPQTAFRSSRVIIDSGTVISRLPPAVYSALRDAFKRGMTMYPAAPALTILDTCFDLRRYTTVSIPTISFTFAGGATVKVAAKGILFSPRLSQVCLAFASRRSASEIAIIGNFQQKTLEVVYDVGGRRIGFASGACS